MSKSANKILHTAEQLFNQHSFVAVGVDLIRDQSGCSKTTLYTYYKNKQQLIAAVLRNRDLRFQQQLEQCVAESTGLDALNKIYDWHMQWFQSDQFKGCMFIRAVAESTPNDQEIIALSQAHKQWMRTFITGYCTDFPQLAQCSQMFELFLEGLISRFMVEGFDPEVAASSKITLFSCITQLNAT
ncbi:TetR family transcriptional regulator [Acinetobacter calcoaceticus]|uniref:TetR family transcriptional regulator n=1 Tax=Acinetobacter calcoaceticus TaxID=471 RepID=A0A4R1XYI8_ACICA|nr:TetR family transcriptional regulator [Acinetobacter calcoaceticus]